MKNIKAYLDVLDQHRDEIALALMSDPGLSKTSQCKQWCEEHGRQYFEFITSQRMPSEISGMAMPDKDTKRMQIYDFDYLLDMKDGDMLAFDEFTNGNIMTLNACLTLIQERNMMSGRKLPSILIVAMGNHQGQCDLLPQTKQRFIWLDVKFDSQAWSKWIVENLGVTPTPVLLSRINDSYQSNFSPTKYNYLTARTATNLLKLAMTIDRDNPIWDNMPDVNSFVINEVYESVNSNVKAKHNDLDDMKDALLAVIEVMQIKMTDEPAYYNELADLKIEIKFCKTKGKLKTLLASVSERYPTIGDKFTACVKKSTSEDINLRIDIFKAFEDIIAVHSYSAESTKKLKDRLDEVKTESDFERVSEDCVFGRYDKIGYAWVNEVRKRRDY